MLMGKDGKNYVVGRGELYFDKFAPGTTTLTGERYLGNTPEFSTSSETEDLEHFDSDHGLNEKDDSVTMSNTRNGSFTTDNVSPENVALFFMSDGAGSVTQTALTAETETMPVKLGRYYQLGTSEDNPAGFRHLDNVVVTLAASPITAEDNFEVDLDLGRVYIESDAVGIAEGDELTFTYDVKASSMTQIISGNTQIEGALRFVSFNPKGEPMDYYYPRVKMSPNGDFALKSGDEWQTIPFNVEFLKKGLLETVYITSRGVSQ